MGKRFICVLILICMCCVFVPAFHVLGAENEEYEVKNDLTDNVFSSENAEMVFDAQDSFGLGMTYGGTESKVSIKAVEDMSTIAFSFNLFENVSRCKIDIYNRLLPKEKLSFVVSNIRDDKFDLYVHAVLVQGEKQENVQSLQIKDIAFAEDSYYESGENKVVKLEIKKRETYQADGTKAQFDAVYCNGKFNLLRQENDEVKEILQYYQSITQSVFSCEVEFQKNQTGDLRLSFYQLGLLSFYDYKLIKNAVSKTNLDSYNKIDLEWKISEELSSDKSGYIVQRTNLMTNKVESVFRFNSKFFNTLSDSKLNVGTKYLYEINAYNGLDEAVPKVAIKYAKFQTETRHGNPSLVIIIIVGIVIATVIVSLIYIYKYELAALLKIKKKHNP